MQREYIEKYNQLILPSTIGEEEEKVLRRGQGVWIYDEDGKKYFDAASQVSMANIGQNHPKLIAWLSQFFQAAAKGEIITTAIATDCYYRNRLELDGEVMELSPVALEQKLTPHIFGGDKTVCFFDVSGAQSINNAIRYFRTITGKKSWISFEKAFHGRHGESRDSSDSNPIHWNEAPRNPNVYFLPFPETKKDFEEGIESLNNIPLADCAVMIYEPIQGEGGGMRVGNYLKDLEKVLKAQGVYSIADEIQAGMGRSGEWFSFQKLGLNPDAIVLGKSLGALVPVSCFALKKEINDSVKFPKGKISGTYPMYALGMAAANFVIRIFEEEKLVEKARDLSPKFGKMLFESIHPFTINNLYGMRLPHIKVDGIGLYRSIKFYDSLGNPDAEYRDLVNQKLRKFGVWTYSASKTFPAIRFTPPLVTEEKDLNFLGKVISLATRTQVIK